MSGTLTCQSITSRATVTKNQSLKLNPLLRPSRKLKNHPSLNKNQKRKRANPKVRMTLIPRKKRNEILMFF